MNRILYVLLVMTSFMACQNPTTGEKSTPKIDQHAEAIKNAQANSNVSASTKANLTDGFWHIGGAVNIKTESGEEGYVGKWIKFNPDMSYEFGKDEQTLNQGAWLFNEKGEFLTFQNKDTTLFFRNEWNAKQIGDIIILKGNTPQNPTGGQIKLVRQDTKIISHNPN